jgi:hypothetical protein
VWPAPLLVVSSDRVSPQLGRSPWGQEERTAHDQQGATEVSAEAFPQTGTPSVPRGGPKLALWPQRYSVSYAADGDSQDP